MSEYTDRYSGLFECTAEILMSDYVSASETPDTVADFCLDADECLEALGPDALAERIATAKGYGRK